jgi:hypothetical protein
MGKVTDPKLIAELNAQAKEQAGSTRVTDPKLIAELNAQAKAPTEKKPIGKLASFGLGATSGIPGVHKIGGLAGAVTGLLADKLLPGAVLGEESLRMLAEHPELAPPDPKEQTFGERFREQVEASKARHEAAKEENPLSYGAGKIAGTAAVMAAPGLGLSGVAPKGALRTVRLLEAAKSGARAGALYSAADSDADSLLGRLSDVASGTAFGAGVGGAGQAAGEAAGAVLRGGGQWLKNVLGEKAYKAIGGIQGDIRSAISRSGVGLDRARQAGLDMAEAGIGTFPETAKSALPKIQGLREVTGDALGRVLPELDDKIDKAGLTGQIGVSVPAIWSRVQKEIIDPLRNSTSSELRAVADKVEKESMNLADAANAQGIMSLNRAHKARMEIDEPLYWNNRDPGTSLPKSYARELRRVLSEEIQRTVDAAGRLIGKGNEGENWSRLNRIFSSVATAEKAAESGAIRSAGNSSIGLRDTIAAGAGFAHGGLPLAIAAGAGAKALRTWGPSLQASAAKAALKLGKYPSEVSNTVGRASNFSVPFVTTPPPEPKPNEEKKESPHSPMSSLMKAASATPQLMESQKDEQQTSADAYALNQTSSQFRAIQRQIDGTDEVDKT